MSRKSFLPRDAWGDIRHKIWIDIWILGSMTALGIGAAVIAGAEDDRIIVVVFAIAVFSTVVLHFAFENRFKRTHTPEERAGLTAESQLRRDRIKIADAESTYKRKVLRTGAEARAVITAAVDLEHEPTDSSRIFYLELAVTVGDDPSYAVRTGEDLPLRWTIHSLWVERELAVRVDPTNRWRVAVDWHRSEQLRQAPALHLQQLEMLRATGAISDAEFTAKREQIIADT